MKTFGSLNGPIPRLCDDSKLKRPGAGSGTGPCEPQLGKRGLYPTLGTRDSGPQVRRMMNLLAYADGSRTLLEIADLIGEPVWELRPVCERLVSHGLLAVQPA